MDALSITISGERLFDSRNSKFIKLPTKKFNLVHSLLSVAKWESKHHKPFLPYHSQPKLNADEWMSYLRCMCIGDIPDVYLTFIWKKHLKEILSYMTNKYSATTVMAWSGSNASNRLPSKPITAEILYFWMFHYSIPMVCERWHINRLQMMIEVCRIKTTDPKKNRMTVNSRKALWNKLNDERNAAVKK